MLPFDWSEPQIYVFFFVLVRVTCLLAFLPLLGERTIPPSVKILFGLSLSYVCFPLVWRDGSRLSPVVFTTSSQTIWAISREVGFGLILGFVARWIFDAAQMAGHFVGTAMGLSMASVIDPHSESQEIAIGYLHYMMAAMLFIAMNGHHIFLSVIVDSFRIVPLGNVDLFSHGEGVLQYLVSMSAEVLNLAIKLSAPVVVVLLLLNLSFGIIARSVPQLNVFVVSFALNILVGLLVAMVSAPAFVNLVSGAFDTYELELFRFMRLFG